MEGLSDHGVSFIYAIFDYVSKQFIFFIDFADSSIISVDSVDSVDTLRAAAVNMYGHVRI